MKQLMLLAYCDVSKCNSGGRALLGVFNYYVLT